jgi:carboxymethylenebutenolidase
VLKDLDSVVQYTKTIKTANGKIISAGFCWWGSQSFNLATVSKDLSAALVFYGSWPANASDYNNISAPIYGFYAWNDDRINATIPDTEKYMSSLGKKYDSKTYPGAWHAFMRLGEW